MKDQLISRRDLLKRGAAVSVAGAVDSGISANPFRTAAGSGLAADYWQYDAPSRSLGDYAFRHHLPKPTNTVPGITYMLAGAEQRSDSQPNDKTSPPIKIGPDWMIMWPFDPKTTGLPTHHKPTGAYIM